MDPAGIAISAVLLAAGGGTRLGAVTTAPKCLLSLGRQTLLQRHLALLQEAGVREAVIVVGYQQELVRSHVAPLALPMDIRFAVNDDYARLGNGYSLYLGLQAARHPPLIIDADLVYTPEILERFLRGGPADKVLVGPGSLEDIECAKTLVDAQGNVRALIDKAPARETADRHFLGEAMGLILLTWEGREALMRCAADFFADAAHRPLNWEHLFNAFVGNYALGTQMETSDRWIEIDTPDDYEEARRRFGNECCG